MPQAGFKPETPATERPQTHALDGAAAEIGHFFFVQSLVPSSSSPFCSLCIKNNLHSQIPSTVRSRTSCKRVKLNERVVKCK
jgi:hypothetical protein